MSKHSSTYLFWFLVPLGLVILLFGEMLFQLAQVWQEDQNYSHGFLVLPLSIGLAWRYVTTTQIPLRSQAGLGLVELSLGILLQMSSMIVPVWWLRFFALALVLQGIAVTIGGREWARGFLFPILFLVFMFPLPRVWTGLAALWLQDCVSQWSAAVLDLFVVCHRQGTSLSLAGVSTPLVVAEACSGLRQIVAFVALGALLSYLSNAGTLARVVLLLAALPIAIIANTARVTLMGLGAYHYGTDWLQGPLHHAPALFSFPFGLFLFLVTWWCLDQLAQRDERTENGH